MSITGFFSCGKTKIASAFNSFEEAATFELLTLLLIAKYHAYHDVIVDGTGSGFCLTFWKKIALIN